MISNFLIFPKEDLISSKFIKFFVIPPCSLVYIYLVNFFLLMVFSLFLSRFLCFEFWKLFFNAFYSWIKNGFQISSVKSSNKWLYFALIPLGLIFPSFFFLKCLFFLIAFDLLITPFGFLGYFSISITCSKVPFPIFLI